MGRQGTGGFSVKRFAILVFPGFPMMAFSAVIEPLRAANVLAGKDLYQWSVIGSSDGPIVASNEISVSPNFAANNAPSTDYIVVCSGGDADRLSAEEPLNWIRKNLYDSQCDSQSKQARFDTIAQ